MLYEYSRLHFYNSMFIPTVILKLCTICYLIWNKTFCWAVLIRTGQISQVIGIQFRISHTIWTNTSRLHICLISFQFLNSFFFKAFFFACTETSKLSEVIWCHLLMIQMGFLISLAKLIPFSNPLLQNKAFELNICTDLGPIVEQINKQWGKKGNVKKRNRKVFLKERTSNISAWVTDLITYTSLSLHCFFLNFP